MEEKEEEEEDEGVSGVAARHRVFDAALLNLFSKRNQFEKIGEEKESSR